MESQGYPRLLVVDDDRKLAGLIRDYLTPMGYDVELRHNGPDGLAEALASAYHAVILDVMMPGMDGFAVLRELRKKSDVPVLMLTALGEEADRIVGLEIGADDYLPKTFSSRELLARVRAVIRRSRIRVEAGMARELVLGPLRLCEETHTAVLDDQALDLTTLAPHSCPASRWLRDVLRYQTLAVGRHGRTPPQPGVLDAFRLGHHPLPPPSNSRGGPHRLGSNLIRNAFVHAGPHAKVSIDAAETADAVSITVTDDGPGVPPAELARLFEAFYRLDRSRNRETGGSGLGLAIVRSAIDACGGTSVAELPANGGFSVILNLPKNT